MLAALTAAGALTANEGAVSSPDRYQAAFDTDQGQFLVEVQQKYAPLGAWRFFNLVRAGFYTDVKEGLPRRRPVHGAVRHQRRPCRLETVREREHPGRPARREQPARREYLSKCHKYNFRKKPTPGSTSQLRAHHGYNRK